MISTRILFASQKKTRIQFDTKEQMAHEKVIFLGTEGVLG